MSEIFVLLYIKYYHFLYTGTYERVFMRKLGFNCLSKLFICLCFFSKMSWAQSTMSYSILMDAGSSGTRVHVFQYQDDATTIESLQLKELPFNGAQSNKSKTPISKTEESNPLGTFQAPFNLALNYLETTLTVPENKIAVYVYSTAGMRVLNEDVRAKINDEISTELQKQHPNFSKIDVQTIDGKQEALFLWLDVNYLKGNFSEHNSSTNGVLDVGGASAQIAYEDDTTENPNLTFEKIHFFQRDYRLYLNSILHGGQDESRKIMISLENNKKIPNPCYILNSDFSVSPAFFSETQCKTDYRQILQSNLVQSENPKNLSLSVMPPSNTNFVATSGAFYIYNFFGAKNNDTVSIGQLSQNIAENCNLEWNSFQQKFSNFDDAYLSQRCANASFIYDLFTSGAFQFKDESTIQVASQLTQNFGDFSTHDIDWTLGALIFLESKK